MKKFAVLLLALVISACASSNVQNYAAVDLSQKTMTVPPGGAGLTGKLKARLVQDGWRLAIDRGPDVTRGKVDGNVDLATSVTFKTRYRLTLDWQEFDTCFPDFSPAIHYDISVVDNDNGSEVLTVSGTDCQNAVVNKFMAAISK